MGSMSFSSACKPRNRGFTLIELMVTIAIVAILAAIAFPNFSYSLRNNRVINQNNDLLSALNYARNEAITRSRGVTICAANTASGATPTTCAAASGWSTGWMVFVDDTVGAGALPASIDATRILRTGTGNPKNQLTLNGNRRFIRFNSRGEAVNFTVAQVFFTLKPATDCSNDQQRRITVTALGRSGSTKEACS